MIHPDPAVIAAAHEATEYGPDVGHGLVVRALKEHGHPVPDRSEVLDLIEAVRKGGVPDEWPEAPAVPGPPTPEPLPLDALPPAVRSHVESVAGATQTPPALGAMLSLAAVSAAIGGRVEVEVDGRGWIEPANIFTAVILPPASRKSAVFSAMTGPLIEWEREEAERIGPARRRALDRVDVADAALTAVKRAAASGKAEPEEVEAARIGLDDAQAKVPAIPRILASDATPEALVRLMAEQGGPVALLAPEADPLGVADGRYSDSARLDELLRAWSGEAIRVDRVNREPVHVERPALTLGLTLQPQALEDVHHVGSFRGRGLLGRVLWAVPPHGLGTRRTGPDIPALDQTAAATYRRILRALVSAGFARAEPVRLTLTSEAAAVLYEFEAEVEAALGDGGRLAGVRDWGGKAHGQAVRVAALIELAGRAEDGRPLFDARIGAWAMDAGVRLVRALSSHALAVLVGLQMDRRTADLTYVLRRAGEIPKRSTLRDLFNATRDRPGLSTMDDLMPVVDELSARGCLRLVEQPREGPGRPPSPIVEIHPEVREKPAQNPRNTSASPNTGGSAGIAGANPGECATTDEPPDDPFSAAEADR